MITIQQLDHNKWLVRDIQDLQFSRQATVMGHGTFPTLDAAISHLIPPGTGKDLKLRIVTLGLEEQRPKFASPYGLSADKLASNPSMTMEEAQKLLDHLHEHFPTINYYRNKRK